MIKFPEKVLTIISSDDIMNADITQTDITVCEVTDDDIVNIISKLTILTKLSVKK